jgi:ethanolamine utilization protein EutP (predicted NTPase)
MVAKENAWQLGSHGLNQIKILQKMFEEQTSVRKTQALERRNHGSKERENQVQDVRGARNSSKEHHTFC